MHNQTTHTAAFNVAYHWLTGDPNGSPRYDAPPAETPARKHARLHRVNAHPTERQQIREARRAIKRDQRKRTLRNKFGPSGRPAPVIVRHVDETKPVEIRPQRVENSTYERYLASSEWKRLRAAVLGRDQHRCAKCRSRQQLHVHHLTYERLGHERLDDLVTLCKHCHAWIHRAVA